MIESYRAIAIRLALCSGLVALNGCDAVSETFGVSATNVLNLRASAASIPADGVSRVTIIATLNGSITENGRRVAFRTTAGNLIGNDVCQPEDGCDDEILIQADVNEDAIIQLESDTDIEPARVQANIGQVAESIVIEFTRAFPNRIDVEIDQNGTPVLEACPGDSVDVTAFLRRSLGEVSDRTDVTFTAVRADNGQMIGGFQAANPFVIEADGDTADVEFSPGDTNYRGNVIIRAAVRNTQTGTDIENTGKVEVVSPRTFGGSDCLREPTTPTPTPTPTANPPVVVAISPAQGDCRSGGLVTIDGFNFGDAASVRFGSVAATTQFVSDNLIDVLVPDAEASCIYNCPAGAMCPPTLFTCTVRVRVATAAGSDTINYEYVSEGAGGCDSICRTTGEACDGSNPCCGGLTCSGTCG